MNRPYWITLPSGSHIYGGVILDRTLDGMGRFRTVLMGVVARSHSRFTPVVYLPTGEPMALTPRYDVDMAKRDLTFYLARKQLLNLSLY